MIAGLMFLFVAHAAMSKDNVASWLPGRPAATVQSAGLTVTISPVPCTHDMPADAGCALGGISAYADLEVTGKGLKPFRMRMEPVAPYHMAEVVQIDRRDRRPGVVLTHDSGGSAGVVTMDVLQPVGRGFRRIRLTRRDPTEGKRVPWFAVSDEKARDLNGDGRLDFVLADPNWMSVWGCNACSPRPPIVMTIMNGRSVDISRDPRVREVFVRDMARLKPGCLSDEPERNGYCAAYVADAARIGRFAPAWATMRHHYNREELVEWEGAPGKTRYPNFPSALRALLQYTGYRP